MNFQRGFVGTSKLSLLGPNADEYGLCSTSMESSKSSDSLQEESNLAAAVRRKNTLLIAILFSFIVSLSLILGGVIIYLVLNRNSQYPTTNPAVYGFCSVAESHRGCISSLSSYKTKPIVFADPIHVYTFSLESAVERLSIVGSILSDNCTTSLQAAADRIYVALAVIRVDPNNETRVFEESGRMVELIVAAMEELRSCRESTAVHRIEMLLRYSRDYLLDYDLAKRNFHLQEIIVEERSRIQIIGFVVDSSAVFGLQYFVMVFLFIMILLRCNFCYIGGLCHKV